MAGFVFSQSNLVFDALRAVVSKPVYYDLPDHLDLAVQELIDAGFAAFVVRPGCPTRVKLTPAGLRRFEAARGAAIAVAAGRPPVY